MSTIHEEPLVPGFGEEADPDMLAAGLTPEEERARRRKKILLIVLGCLAALFMVIAGWYLLTRKPLTELPILAVDTVPEYKGVVNTDFEPMGVAVSGDGDRIYVTAADGRTSAHILDSSGAIVGTLTPPKESGAAHMPTYPVLSPGGEVYVTDRITSEVYVYDENGEYLRTFAPKGKLAKSWAPLALAVDSAGNVYANDAAGQQTIRKFAADGTELAQFGQPGETSFVNGLVVDDKGTSSRPTATTAGSSPTRPKVNCSGRSTPGRAPVSSACPVAWPGPAITSTWSTPSTRTRQSTTSRTDRWPEVRGDHGVRGYRRRDVRVPERCGRRLPRPDLHRGSAQPPGPDLEPVGTHRCKGARHRFLRPESSPIQEQVHINSL